MSPSTQATIAAAATESSQPAAVTALATAKSISGQKKPKQIVSNGADTAQQTLLQLRKKSPSPNAGPGKVPRGTVKSGKDNVKRSRSRPEKRTPDVKVKTAPVVESVKSKGKQSSATPPADATTPSNAAPAKVPSKQPAKQQRAKQQASTTPRGNGAAQPKAAAVAVTTQRKPRRSPQAPTPSNSPGAKKASPSRHASPSVATQAQQTKRSNNTPPSMIISPARRPMRDHAYAGPRFSNSPDPSCLPIPDFFFKQKEEQAVSGSVPSLSPASSTTSLQNYSSNSAPASPTRSFSDAQLLGNSTNASSASYEPTFIGNNDASAVRTRSRDLLTVLREAAFEAHMNEHVYTMPKQPMAQPSSAYMSYSPPQQYTQAYAQPYSQPHVLPATSTSSYTSSEEEDVIPTLIELHKKLMREKEMEKKHHTETAFFSATPAVPAPPVAREPTAADKNAINEMYSNGLRALLKIDVRA